MMIVLMMLLVMMIMLMLMPPPMLPCCLVRVTLALIFCPLVSDHVVTLNCFTVRAHFFDFPIDFF